ncbi:unnamed protein product [Pleuronectes platessa]|uniref:Uncharacterized protein n=1 Tax=Pleuronectes platessa TaxID=8262 RepID=A0A9N7VJ89_PLEPL|nr:unnamed protein product [Pleuronectes platessa]
MPRTKELNRFGVFAQETLKQAAEERGTFQNDSFSQVEPTQTEAGETEDGRRDDKSPNKSLRLSRGSLAPLAPVAPVAPLAPGSAHMEHRGPFMHQWWGGNRIRRCRRSQEGAPLEDASSGGHMT